MREWGRRFVILVHYGVNTLAVVEDKDGVGLGVRGHLKAVHDGIALLVVGRVDQDLLKDLVEARGERHVPLLERVLV